jgi:predicted RNA binding protein YcfA (HicA-like mRNA interferase family)
MKTYNELIESLATILEVNLNTRDFISGMKKEGWQLKRQTGGHDVYEHPNYKGISAIPRAKVLSFGVHRSESKKREEALRGNDGAGRRS